MPDITTLSEVEQCFVRIGITTGAAYYRIRHLLDIGAFDGSLISLQRMLATDDVRLVQLDIHARQLLERMVTQCLSHS